MSTPDIVTEGGAADLARAVEGAIRAIPPAWPLASSVAVNPYLGQSETTLAEVNARLGRVAGLPATMPRAWYDKKLSAGTITDSDLEAAIAASPHKGKPADAQSLRAIAKQTLAAPSALPNIADLAAQVSGIDWPNLIAERIGAWASSYFDEGQALWAPFTAGGAYASWRSFATHDLTAEIIGLSGFAAHISGTPQSATDLIARASMALKLPNQALDTYFHQLLMSLGGWAQFARYRLWQAELGARHDSDLVELLAIRLVWDEALISLYGPAITETWTATILAHCEPVTPNAEDIANEILQEASERAGQRHLIAVLSDAVSARPETRPALQAAFCIDVRSEVFRRALEATDQNIQTLGFAGFFGLTTSHRRFASDVEELRLPVLLNPGVHSCSGGPETKAADLDARFAARATRAWGRFKLAAVSSFAFVEATGPIYVGKLLRDSLKSASAPKKPDPMPRLDPALDMDALINAGESVLRAMSLTRNFARVVLVAGHGANVVNNPHASALHCGACGGYSGEVNARLLASMLNIPDVRAGIAQRGIDIPADTVFIAALHDTTTDDVTIYEGDQSLAGHGPDMAQVKTWLSAAGVLTRTERALRLPGATGGSDVEQRSRDWSQVRPEWALAGCKAFIAAPRARTSGRDLKGQAFLHDYNWSDDKGFGVLELIMTAPVVVASWISLQYYGSSVAPEFFGAGNKLLHNVAGGIGVLEGNGGMLRTGLPWQSVHDGVAYAHDPLRLSIIIEAPREAMTDVLRKHANVRALFDNRWLHLFAIDESGKVAWRYRGDLEWEAV